MKATKVYTKTLEWQLAKREDGIWFYREWVVTSYGPSWGKWKLLGLLKEAKILEDSILTDFEDSWKIKVKNIYAYFKNTVFIIKNVQKQYKNKLILPDEEIKKSCS